MRTALVFAVGAIAGVIGTAGFALWLFSDLINPLKKIGQVASGPILDDGDSE